MPTKQARKIHIEIIIEFSTRRGVELWKRGCFYPKYFQTISILIKYIFILLLILKLKPDETPKISILL